MDLPIKEKVSKIGFALALFLLLFFLPSLASAANLSVSPTTGEFEVGGRVTVRIIASSNVPFNAVSGLVSFPPALFSVESVSKSGSLLDFWVTEPTVSNTVGTVKFEGVALGGYYGSSGTVVTLNMRALRVGSGPIAFKFGQILANDGEGTDITGNFTGATYSIKEAAAKPTPTIIPKPEIITPPVVEVVQPSPSLRAPLIALSKENGKQIILGTSDYGDAQVLLTFTAENGFSIFIIGASDRQGGFTLPVPSTLKRGIYTVTAVMIQEDNLNSEKSNEVRVKVGNILSDASWELSFAFFLLLLVLLYLLLRIYFHLRRDKNIHKIIKREVHEAEDVIHKSFSLLREDMHESAGKKSSSADRKKIDMVEKDIDDAEKIITKEVRDIE